MLAEQQQFHRRMRPAEALLREAIALLDGTPSDCWGRYHENGKDQIHIR